MCVCVSSVLMCIKMYNSNDFYLVLRINKCRAINKINELNVRVNKNGLWYKMMCQF